jgi:hypothetical protein
MVKLKNIKRNNGYILCLAFVENCQEPIQLALNETSAELDNYRLPVGYEWCISHITHARKYLRSLIGKPIELTQRTIMWY